MARDARGRIPRARRFEATHRPEQRVEQLGERQLIDADEDEEELGQHEARGRTSIAGKLGGSDPPLQAQPCEEGFFVALDPPGLLAARLRRSGPTARSSSSISACDSSCVPGRTMITTSVRAGKSPGLRRNASRTSRFERLRSTAPPHFFEATTPSRGASCSGCGASKTRRWRVDTRAPLS